MKRRLQQFWAVIIGIEVVAATIYYFLGIHHYLAVWLAHWS